MSAAVMMAQRRMEAKIQPPVAEMFALETNLGTPAEVALGAGLTVSLSMIRSVIELYLPDDPISRIHMLQRLHSDLYTEMGAMFEDMRIAGQQ